MQVLRSAVVRPLEKDDCWGVQSLHTGTTSWWCSQVKSENWLRTASRRHETEFDHGGRMRYRNIWNIANVHDFPSQHQVQTQTDAYRHSLSYTTVSTRNPSKQPVLRVLPSQHKSDTKHSTEKMELPFAVESSDHSLPPPTAEDNHRHNDEDDDDACSLVTASSQGSLIQSQSSYEPILAKPQTSRAQQPLHHHPSDILLSTGQTTAGYSISASPHHDTATKTTRTASKLAAAASNTFASSFASTGSRVASVFSSLKMGTTTEASQQQQQQLQLLQQQQQQQLEPQREPLETIDFTYVNVWETDADEVDILLPHQSNDPGENTPKGDVLTLLLNRIPDCALVQLLEQANQSVTKAARAKQEGELQQALDHHAASAKLFYQAALASKEHHGE
jgi:hypothetical protein